MNKEETKNRAPALELLRRVAKRDAEILYREGFVRGFWIGSILTAIGIVLTAWLIHKI